MRQSTQSLLPAIAAKMIREKLTFRQAITALGVVFSSQEAQDIELSSEFRKTLEGEQMAYYQELADNPNFTKTTIVGEMLHCVKMLVKDGSYDKAVEALFKLAKLQDWVGSENQGNILLMISDKDIQEAKQKISASKKLEGGPKTDQKQTKNVPNLDQIWTNDKIQ